MKHAHLLTCCIRVANAALALFVCVCVVHLTVFSMLFEWWLPSWMVYLACYCGKHFSRQLHPVAIPVEIGKADFCSCSSSQFSWMGPFMNPVKAWWEKCSPLSNPKQTSISIALSCQTHPVFPCDEHTLCKCTPCSTIITPWSCSWCSLTL